MFAFRLPHPRLVRVTVMLKSSLCCQHIIQIVLIELQPEAGAPFFVARSFQKRAQSGGVSYSNVLFLHICFWPLTEGAGS